MRALLIIIFMWNKVDSRWRIHVRPKWFLLGGGFAVPDIEAIRTQEELDTLRCKFARALIAAPIASLILGMILVGVGISLMLMGTNKLPSFGFFLAIYSIILTTLYLLVSLIDAGSLVGDFPAYKKMKKNDFFAYSEIYHYFSMASNPTQKRHESDFLKDKLDTYIKNLDRSLATLNLISEFLMDAIVYQIPLGHHTKSYVDYHIKFPQVLLNKRQDESAFALVIHLCYYLYSIRREEEAVSLFERLKANATNPNAVEEYYFKQAEHLLKIADHLDFLTQREHIKTTQLYWLMDKFEGYYIDEELLNKGIIQIDLEKPGENELIGVEIDF